MGPCMSAHQEGGCFCRGAEAIGANRQPCSSWTASLEDRGSRLGDRGSEPSLRTTGAGHRNTSPVKVILGL